MNRHDELGERLDREIRLYQSPANRGGFMELLKGIGEYGFYPARLNLLIDLKAEREALKADDERLRRCLKISLDSMQDLAIWIKDRETDIKSGFEDFGELQNLYADLYPEQQKKEGFW